MVLEHDKSDPCKAHAWRTHVHMTHAQKFEVGYRRVVLRQAALSFCIHLLIYYEYLSRVLHIYATNWDIALATIFGAFCNDRISSLARYPNL